MLYYDQEYGRVYNGSKVIRENVHGVELSNQVVPALLSPQWAGSERVERWRD